MRLDVTQPEVMCRGEEVPVAYAGVVRTEELTTGSGRVGSSSRFRADLSWRQSGVDYSATVHGSYRTPPGGRTSTYRFVASGSGSDGSRVHLLEVVHARSAPDSAPQVLVSVERVSCGR